MEKDYDIKELEREVDSLSKGGKSWDKYIRVFVTLRWVINILVIGLPWMFISFLMLIYNIVINAWINKWWAKGNLWLLGNTILGIVQMIASWPLIFEFSLYLRWFWFFRWISLFWAVTYNTIYLGLLAGWLIQTFSLPEVEMEEVGTVDILLNMFFMYNTIIHSSIVIINAGIIIKEIEMQFYQLVKGGTDSQYNLSFTKAEEKFNKQLWFLNPYLIFSRAWYAIFRWHVEDIWSYNNDDSDKFVSNWGKK